MALKFLYLISGSIAAKILTELLEAYSSSSSSSALGAEEATALAKELLVLILSNPDLYIFDFAMSLGPVRALEGQKIYEVRDQRVTGNRVGTECV